MAEIVRRHYWFSGRVQGVGFRYRSYYIARDLGLAGWVRNSWDERVEMELEGSREAIAQMLVQLRQQRYIEIDTIEEEEIPADGCGGFFVR